MSERTRDYDYILPEELIAQHPLPRRDDSRMIVLHREPKSIEHWKFGDLSAFVSRDDLLVLNNTRVLPARRFSDDGRIEFLFLEKLAPSKWKCLVKPGRKMRVGATARIDGALVQVEEIGAEGERVIYFDREIDPFQKGRMPLPPYLHRDGDTEGDLRYQTVFADVAGAIAAPTAGLHFTREILSQLPHVFVTLHVGTGTFRPVQSERITGHRMQAERFSISEKAAGAINRAQRIVAVGTTTVRVLEAAARRDGKLFAQEAATALFIHPPYAFREVDRLLTNFHLPRSTLLMLVCAFADREFVLEAYAEAVRKRYRFYSYGDCMLIL
jgi:S-adenosylmethionine:tRNA ribosyltransferase-isomerase